MAETLINQAKKVREGEYAILVNSMAFDINNHVPENMEYYKRENNIWVLDKNINSDSFIKDKDILCNIDYGCIYNEKSKEGEQCTSTTVSKDTVMENALKNILNQFDANYNISAEQIKKILDEQMSHYITSINQIKDFQTKDKYKYNNYHYKLGLEVKETGDKYIFSPYTKLKDLIIGQSDFVKKQKDIIRFVQLYCREGNANVPNINDSEMESEWWLYCKETNTKLIPIFRYTLATTFITNNDKYDDVLSELIKNIGVLSDDGSSWVDKHSGEVIGFIDFDSTEGYKDGFVDKGRDIIEQDFTDMALNKEGKEGEQNNTQINKKLSKEELVISNVITTLSSNMGIDIENTRMFIVKIVGDLMKDVNIIETEPAYKKREEIAAKKGKQLPSYDTIHSTTLMYLILGVFLITLQTKPSPW
jgi:hypothetical protein